MRKGWTERRKVGREEASGGRREQWSEGEEKGRSVGGREIGKLQGRYPEEDTGQYTAVSAQNNTQHGPCHCDFGITGIVMHRNVLFDKWMT